MSKKVKETKNDNVETGDNKEKIIKSSRINDGFCCRCTKRTCDHKCKLTGKYVARKHKCDAKNKNGKLGFTYKD